MIIKPTASVALMMAAVTSATTTWDYTTGPCMNELYQTKHFDNLVCKSTTKFWTKVSLKAQPTCIINRTLTVQELIFDAKFESDFRDFAVFAYTGEAKPAMHQALYGEKCAVQAFGPESDIFSGPFSMIKDDDGDTCHDVIVAPGAILSTKLAFSNDFKIPCTDYGTGSNTVKLQFCSSWRSLEDDMSCDTVGPYPCSPTSCWCDMIDLGIEVLGPEFAVRFTLLL